MTPLATRTETVAFLGAGNMASALIRALRRDGLDAGRLVAFDLDESKVASLRDELRVLLTEVGSLWQSAVFPLDIRNCGVPGPAADPRVRFDFRCARVWETLRATEAPDVRACDACAQPVYRCHTHEEADRRARRGECIAVDPALTASTEPPMEGLVIGMPRRLEENTSWSERLFGRP